MGKILVKILDWMGDPKNKKKLESLGRFLKDWWPALTAAFVLFATPLGGFIRTVVSGMVRLTGFLLKKAIPTLLRLIAKNPIAALALATVGTTAVMAYNASRDGTAVIKDPKNPGKSHLDEIMDSGGMTGSPMGGMFSGGGGVPDWLAMAGGGNAFMKPMGTDTVPAMLSPGEFVMSKGAVDKFGSDFMESINAAGGGTNKPKVMGGTTYAAGGGGVGNYAPLFDLIAKGEGNYNSINRGEAGDSPGGAKKYLGKDLTAMKVSEIMDLQAQEKLYAAGKYQIVPTTMKDFVARGGVSKSDMFDAATQEKFPKYVVYTKRPVVGKYLDGKASLEDAIIHLSAEFASIGVPRDMKAGEFGNGYPKSDRPKGSTFYGGTSNAAHTTPEKVAAALKKIKGGGANTGSGRDGTFGDGTYGSGRPSDPKPSGDPIHPKDDPGLRHKIPDNAGTDSLGNRNYGLKPGMSDTVGHKGKNYHFTKTEDGWKVTDGGIYGFNKQPVDPSKVPGLVRAFHEKHGHRGTGRNRDGSDKVDPNAGNDTTTDSSQDSSQDSSGNDKPGVALKGVDFSTLKGKGGAFSDMFAEARANLGTKPPSSSSSSPSPSSSSSSSPSPKIDPTKVTNNPTNLTSNVDFNLGDVELDPTMQLKDLPGGMDANQLARAHAKTNQLSPEQTELLAKQAVKFTKKNGRAPTKSEINKLSVNIFGADVGKKVTDPETLKLIDEEKNINKSKLTPIPLDKVAPTEKLKPVKKDQTEIINNPPMTEGAQQDPNNRANVANDPEFPTVSQSREAKEVRQMVLANTLGGEYA